MGLCTHIINYRKQKYDLDLHGQYHRCKCTLIFICANYVLHYFDLDMYLPQNQPWGTKCDFGLREKYQDHSAKKFNNEISRITYVGSFDFDIYTHIINCQD